MIDQPTPVAPAPHRRWWLWPVLGGLGLAVMTQLFGFLCIGMGHGWDVPSYISHYGFMLFPIAWIARSAPHYSRIRDTALTGAVLLAGFALFDQLLYLPFQIYRPDDFDTATYNAILISLGVVAVAIAITALVAIIKRRPRAILPMALILTAITSNLAIYVQATMDTGGWGYRGDLEFLWFPWWALWQVMAIWAVVRALRPDASGPVSP